MVLVIRAPETDQPGEAGAKAAKINDQ